MRTLTSTAFLVAVLVGGAIMVPVTLTDADAIFFYVAVAAAGAAFVGVTAWQERGSSGSTRQR